MAPFLFPQMCGGVCWASVEGRSEWRRECSHSFVWGIVLGCCGGLVRLVPGNVPRVMCGGVCGAAVEGVPDWWRKCSQSYVCVAGHFLSIDRVSGDILVIDSVLGVNCLHIHSIWGSSFGYRSRLGVDFSL